MSERTQSFEERELGIADETHRAKVAEPEDPECEYNPTEGHVLKRLPGVTSTGVKISECILCGEQFEEDVA